MGVLDEFREFALKGNVLDMAVGIILGAAFGTIVNSLVEDVLMPPIALVTAGVDVTQLHVVISQGSPPGPYRTVEAARQAGAVTINYGEFLTSLISFALVALALFFLVRAMNRMRRDAEDPDETDLAVDEDMPVLRLWDPGEGPPVPAVHERARRPRGAARLGRPGARRSSRRLSLVAY